MLTKLEFAFVLLGSLCPGFSQTAGAFQGAGSETTLEIQKGVTLEELETALNLFGWEAKILIPEEGDPEFVEIHFEDIESWATLRDCDDPSAGGCQTVLFFANFSLGRKLEMADIEILNSYNDEFVVGRAYFLKKEGEDPDEVGVDLRVSLKGGVTRLHFNEEAAGWETVVFNFIGAFQGE